MKILSPGVKELILKAILSKHNQENTSRRVQSVVTRKG